MRRAPPATGRAGSRREGIEGAPACLNGRRHTRQRRSTPVDLGRYYGQGHLTTPGTTVDTVVSLCKRRGFVYPSGEIYGGTRSAWDYGPLGVELKDNIKRQWWKSMVIQRDDVVGLDSAIILPRETWVASGHVATFSDPLVECLSCHKRFRADHLQEAVAEKRAKSGDVVDPDTIPLTEIVCTNCGTRGQWTEPRAVLRPAEDLPRRRRGRVGPALPAAGDRPGHLPQLPQRHELVAPQAAVRHRPDRQVVPQRDHARQLHLPHARVRADGDGVLRQAGRGRGVAPEVDRRPHRAGTSASASTPTTCATSSTPRRSSPTTRSGPSTSSTGSTSPARSGASSRASPTAPTSTSRRTRSTRAPSSSTSTRRRVSATPPTSSSRRPACRAR